VTKSDKGNTLVILYERDYNNKTEEFITQINTQNCHKTPLLNNKSLQENGLITAATELTKT
jgi:hypothetical protein